ncbi:MAG TPA: hypothetical protein VFI25_02685 [Planctomycetota bacterium]|jgi:hypothetical protein|nr:hypothetical protein [Planctomycetota bacterium]
MPDSESSQARDAVSRFWPPVTALLLLALGIFHPRAPLKTARPDVANPFASATEPGTIPARLWEDPLEAVSRSPRVESPAPAPDQAATTEGSEPLLPGLDGVPKGSRLLLPVLLPGGPHAEDRETRLRTRRAVLMALAAEGYVPEQSDRLRYLVVRDPLPRVPYELLVLDPGSGDEEHHPFLRYDLVVLCWIDEARLLLPFGEKRTTPNLLGALSEIVAKFCRGIRSASKDPESVAPAVRAIGPTDSAGLVSLLAADPKGPAFPEGTELHSPWATIDDGTIRGKGDKHPSLVGQPPGPLRLAEWRLTVHRTIQTDDKVVGALLAELDLRRAIPTTCDRRMILLYEWDTGYGRALKDLFWEAFEVDLHLGPSRRPWLPRCRCCSARQFACCEAPTAGGCCPHLRVIGYMRGLDGMVSGGRGPDEEAAGREEGSRASGSVNPSEEPFGRSQLDYARRLASRLGAEETSRPGGTRIASIGILGTDVYDKLLLLRALRPAFPQALFFTTDLDARLLDPDEQDFARNLIVASANGIAPDDEEHRVAPSFRDSYQTSVYRTCRGILRGSPEDLGPPVVFEVGRTDANRLRAGTWSADSASARKPHPNSRRGTLGLAVLVGLLGLVAGIAWLRPPLLRWFRALPIETRRRTLRGIGIAAVFVAALAACILYDIHRPGGEPFALWEGISAWPTEILRALVILLGAGLLLQAEAQLASNARDIEETYHFERGEGSAGKGPSAGSGRGSRGEPDDSDSNPGATGGASRGSRKGLWARLESLAPLAWPLTDPIPDARGTWAAYREHNRLEKRWWRIVRFVFLLLVPGCLAFLLFSWPTRPVRGFLCSVADLFLEGGAFLATAVVTLAVLDRSLAARRFVRALTAPGIGWDAEALGRFPTKEGKGIEEVGEWLDVEVIAKRTESVERTVYGPFVLVPLLWISRDSHFDNWGWPVPFLVVGIALLLAAVVSIALVRRSAERARASALERLEAKIEEARGKGGQDRVDLLARLAERVRSERRGAFSPFLDNPVPRALLIPFGGLGSWTFLQSIL